MSGKTKFIWLFHECQKTMILCIDLGGWLAIDASIMALT